MAEGLRKITNYITNAVSDILGDVREKESNQKIKEVHKWDSEADVFLSGGVAEWTFSRQRKCSRIPSEARYERSCARVRD